MSLSQDNDLLASPLSVSSIIVPLKGAIRWTLKAPSPVTRNGTRKGYGREKEEAKTRAIIVKLAIRFVVAFVVVGVGGRGRGVRRIPTWMSIVRNNLSLRWAHLTLGRSTMAGWFGFSLFFGGRGTKEKNESGRITLDFFAPNAQRPTLDVETLCQFSLPLRLLLNPKTKSRCPGSSVVTVATRSRR